MQVKSFHSLTVMHAIFPECLAGGLLLTKFNPKH